MLITFEGIDGSGKSTQARKLFSYLKEKGYKVSLYREPGGTSLGERIREILLKEDMDEKSELFLFEASRAELIRTVIEPELKSSRIVILDRFTDSTLAYQGYGRGLDLSFIRKLNQFTTESLLPDLTFLLDLDPEVAMSRIRRRTRFDDLEFLKRVRDGFLKIAEEEPYRVVVLSAELPEDEVFELIKETLKERFSI